MQTIATKLEAKQSKEVQSCRSKIKLKFRYSWRIDFLYLKTNSSTEKCLKGEVRAGWGPAKPLQVLRPTDPPVQSLSSGLKQPFLISKPCIIFFHQLQLKIQVRDIAAIYDSYNCGIIWKFGHCRPWPSKRQGFRSLTCQNISWTNSGSLRYVGYGPTKNYAVRALRRKRCPVKCRPEAHKDWEYCWTMNIFNWSQISFWKDHQPRTVR